MAIVESTLCRKLELMLGARAELVDRKRLENGTRTGLEVLVFELFGHPEARYCYAWEADGRVQTTLGPDRSTHAGTDLGRRVSRRPRRVAPRIVSRAPPARAG